MLQDEEEQTNMGLDSLLEGEDCPMAKSDTSSDPSAVEFPGKTATAKAHSSDKEKRASGNKAESTGTDTSSLAVDSKDN